MSLLCESFVCLFCVSLLRDTKNEGYTVFVCDSFGLDTRLCGSRKKGHTKEKCDSLRGLDTLLL